MQWVGKTKITHKKKKKKGNYYTIVRNKGKLILDKTTNQTSSNSRTLQTILKSLTIEMKGLVTKWTSIFEDFYFKS